MKVPKRSQLKVRLEGDLDAVVRRYCAAHNVTQTALVQAALRDYISQASPYEALMKRLDRVSRQLEGQRSMLHLIAEALGGYVLLWLGHTPEVHPENIAEARRGAQARYRRWADHVAQRLTGADSFFLQFAPLTAVDAAVSEPARADEQCEPA